MATLNVTTLVYKTDHCVLKKENLVDNKISHREGSSHGKHCLLSPTIRNKTITSIV